MKSVSFAMKMGYAKIMSFVRCVPRQSTGYDDLIKYITHPWNLVREYYKIHWCTR